MRRTGILTNSLYLFGLVTPEPRNLQNDLLSCFELSTRVKRHTEVLVYMSEHSYQP